MGSILGGTPKPKKQAAPAKAAAPVQKENEAVKSAQQEEMRRGMASSRRNTNLLQSSNYGSSQRNLLG